MIIMYYFPLKILHTSLVASVSTNLQNLQILQKHEHQLLPETNRPKICDLSSYLNKKKCNKNSVEVINNINHAETNVTATRNECNLICQKMKHAKSHCHRRRLHKRLRSLFINSIMSFASIFFINWPMNYFLIMTTCLFFILHNHDRNTSFNNNKSSYIFLNNLSDDYNAKIHLNRDKNFYLIAFNFRISKFKFKRCLKQLWAYVKSSILVNMLSVSYRFNSISSLLNSLPLTIGQCKTLFLIFFLFPHVLKSSSTLAQQVNLNDSSNGSNKYFDNDLRFASTVNLDDNTNNNSTNKTEGLKNCRPYIIDFDMRMFKQLNMHDTILGLYRSCFKGGMTDDLGKPDDESGVNCEEEFFFNMPEMKYHFILYKLFHNSQMLNADILYRIQLVCGHEIEKETSGEQLNMFDKLYLLATYEHNLCGSIFKNSIQHDHLISDILGLKQNTEEPSFYSDITSNFLKKTRDTNTSQIDSLSAITTETDFLGFYLRTTTKSPTMPAFNLSNSHGHELPQFLNNCTLILLNTYLLAYKTQCDNEEFVESLNHYDCTSTDFSVRSDCKQCEEAYKIWLCTANIPYYENGTLIRPCQRYCFNVQNLCPFLRPIDDTYGGQPVFHCRNVIQAAESDKTHGLEDDDENYYDEDDPLDDDKCYHACNSESNRTIIDVDLYKLFRKEVESRQDANADDSLSFSLSLFSLNNSRFSIINSWPLLKSSTAASSSRFTKLIEINNQRRFNELSTRFSEYQECIFSFPSSKANLFTFDLLLYYSFVLFMSVQRIFNFNL